MRKKYNILGLIPARGNSKGIKKKNLVSVKGKPLIYYTIREALKSSYLKKIIVSTDSPEIAKVSRALGVNVPFLRPKKFSRDKSTDLEAVRHALEWFKTNQRETFDIVVYLRPTSPLRKYEDIDRAIKKFINSKTDSVRTISKIPYHPYWMVKCSRKGQITPFVKGKSVASCVRRQDLPELYMGNGAVEVFNPMNIERFGDLYGKRVIGIKMDENRSMDIDDYVDIKIIENSGVV